MPSFNKSILMGNLTRDVEIKTTPSGLSIGTFTLAINSRRKKGNEYVDECDFIDCKAFGKTADLIAQYVRKGQPLHIEGRLKQESWEDKQSGQKRSKLVVNVDNFQFLTTKQQQSHPHDDPNNWPGEPAGVGSDKGPPNDDDIPF